MYKGKRIAVVSPAYNCAEHIRNVINTIPKFVDYIIVVDDGSKDATSKVARSTQDPRLVVIRQKNKGVGGAIVTGHKRAIKMGADISCVMAGDGQMDPKYLHTLIDPIIEEGYDYTKGNRFMKKEHLQGMPKHRVKGNIMLTFLTKMTSGYWNIYDPQNGYTAITKEVLQKLPLDDIAERYSFENDMLVQMNVFDLKTLDVPIPALYKDEKSHIKIYSFVPSTLIFLVKAFWKRIFKKYLSYNVHPIGVYYLVGFPLLIFGFFFGFSLILFRFLFYIQPTTSTVLISVMSFLVGIQLVLQAISLDIENMPQ